MFFMLSASSLSSAELGIRGAILSLVPGFAEPTQARHLAAHMRDSFRSIAYGYMSRIRRADADLHFPERVVQLHKVDPVPEELELINVVASAIQGLNRLSQISILQVVISRPHALLAQLKKMAANATVPQRLAARVDEIVSRIGTTAKLRGLACLVDTEGSTVASVA